jgi:site-specific recombinase XerD
MEKNGKVKTLQQGLTLFETVGMPARDLAARTRQEYANDLTDLIASLEKQGITKLSHVKLQHLELSLIHI